MRQYTNSAGDLFDGELIKPKSMQLIIVFVKGQMCLCDQAGNFCHRSIELIDPIIIAREHKWLILACDIMYQEIYKIFVSYIYKESI